ncbi:hypothetical protein HY948_05245 [Candidatus Gottesmanbacteria bacterium]|nr:hypothetical protein [Candidatus Gottesmanbacteria bacterium]
MPLIKLLLQNNCFRIYLIGGFIRDTIVGTNPRDVDYKVIVNGTNFSKKMDQVERELTIQKVHYQRSNEKDMVILRTKMKERNGKQTLSSDVAFVPNKKRRIEDLIGADYTVDAFNIQLPSVRGFSLFTAQEDLSRKIIRLSNHNANLRNKPHLLFRAIFLCSKMPNFIIERNTLKHIIENSRYAEISLEQMTTTTDKIIGNFLQNQIFCGWLSNSKKYISLLEKTGLLYEIVTYTAKYLNIPNMRAVQSRALNVSNINKSTNFKLFWKTALRYYGYDNSKSTIETILKLYHLDKLALTLR